MFSTLEDHVCLLDCIALDLQEMDIFAAERLPSQPWDSGGKPPETSDLIFPSYSVRRTGENLLKDCCRLKLKVERNLDKYALLLTIVVVAKVMIINKIVLRTRQATFCVCLTYQTPIGKGPYS